VQNLFDEQYQEMAWRPMPGRSFFLSLNLAYQPDS
jgi:outer membrane cobalamin receptor